MDGSPKSDKVKNTRSTASDIRQLKNALAARDLELCDQARYAGMSPAIASEVISAVIMKTRNVKERLGLAMLEVKNLQLAVSASRKRSTENEVEDNRVKLLEEEISSLRAQNSQLEKELRLIATSCDRD